MVSVDSGEAHEGVAEQQRRAKARQWGRTALAFICSAAATGIFGLLSYVLWPVNRVPAVPCCALAIFFFLIFAYNSYAIIRWWIVLAPTVRARRE